MRSTLPRCAAAALIVIGLVLVPAALGAFSSPINLSPGGQSSSTPAIAVSANGSGVAAWTRFDGNNSIVQARVVSAGSLGPVHKLSAPGSSAFAPQVAVDADGDAIVVWTRLDGSSILQARRISSTGTLGPVLDISPHGEDASGPQVSADADGDAIVLWFRANVGNQRVFSRAVPASGPLGPVRGLSAPGAGGTQPQVDVSQGGDGYVVWVASDGVNSRAQGRTIDTAGTFGARRFLSAPGANAGFPRVDVDESGNAYAIWTRDIGGNTRAQGRPVSSTGTLGAITTLSDAGQNAILPAVSIGSTSGVAVWARSDGSDTRIQAVAVSPTGATGSVTTLSAAGHGATSPQVAADSGGNSQVVWQRSDGSHLRIQERPYAPLATPEPVQNLSHPGGDAAAPAIAFDPDGGPAIAVWTEPNGGGVQRVRAATGP